MIRHVLRGQKAGRVFQLWCWLDTYGRRDRREEDWVERSSTVMQSRTGLSQQMRVSHWKSPLSPVCVQSLDGNSPLEAWPWCTTVARDTGAAGGHWVHSDPARGDLSDTVVVWPSSPRVSSSNSGQVGLLLKKDQAISWRSWMLYFSALQNEHNDNITSQNHIKWGCMKLYVSP